VDICSSRLDGIFQTRWIGRRYVSLLSIRQRNVWNIPFDRALIELYRRDEGKIFLIVDRKCALWSPYRSLPFRCSGLRYQLIESIDRGKSCREMWIGSSRNLLIIEKVRRRRVSRILRAAERSPRYVFLRSRAKRFARAIRFAKTWLRGTRKRSRSDFILHLWRRARMLFLSKLFPIWNIRSLTLRTDVISCFFILYLDASVALENRNFSITAYRSVLDVDCGDSLKNAETRMLLRQAVGRMIYACLMGTTAVVIFPVKASATCATWLTCRESGNGLIEKTQLSRGEYW